MLAIRRQRHKDDLALDNAKPEAAMSNPGTYCLAASNRCSSVQIRPQNYPLCRGEVISRKNHAQIAVDVSFLFVDDYNIAGDALPDLFGSFY